MIKSVFWLPSTNLYFHFSSKSFNLLSASQKTTTRASTTTTIHHQPNMKLVVKIMDVILRKIAVAAIKSAKRIHRAITRQTAQVPRDQQAGSFHRSARKIGIIPRAWT
jgi:3-hydroxy-3-methylglutaryl CoA synthase